ncbi:hypothetical protein QF117_02570 [Vibrio sp. YMD68]|uniref:hypothetical protein n=1 Tax=Vibrio sp. YMD68 TaxID=3042300 RepID=UPI00249BA036|nr:hypothetical protein [Vibrio sp. YMD68]WGV98864.1 hypothetical protein QF117_02570 [Vibrio sp. YMD68]
MKPWKMILPLSGLLLLGCTNKPVDIVPIAYNNSQSEALNKANQTFLTQSYKHGFDTVKSPLKDFSQQEIEDVKTSLSRSSGGGASLFFGTMNILTGNFIGAIDVAGGAAAEMAHSNHVAAHSQWVVALNAKEFSDGLEAKHHASNTIQMTAIKLLEEKGNTLTKVFLREEGKATLTGARIAPETAYVLNDSLRLFGLYESEFYHDKGEFKLGKTNLVPYEQQYVSVRDSKVFGGVANFKSFIDGDVIGYEGVDGYEQFLLDLTGQLPEGYLLYIPSFPKAIALSVESMEDWSCRSCRQGKSYILNSQIVPAIYTEGRKLEFIEPANDI